MRNKDFLQGDEAVGELSALVPKLLSWYRENKRSMRWRDEPSPYYVWVSEIMLQQTRIEAVKRYFDRFIDRIPDIGTLAGMEEDALLKLWEGLGYYNRVRNMRKAAIMVMERFEGELPSDYALLTSLPGIGSYTAGAIASISYGIPVPCVDGNVLRVLMRILGCYEDVAKASTKKDVERLLLKVMPKDKPGDFNQGVMELGETVCIPNGKPLCGKCPVKDYCKAHRDEVTDELPVKVKKKQRRVEEKTILLIKYLGRYAIRKREIGGLLPGLWEIPNVKGRLSKRDVGERFRKVSHRDISHIGEAKHVFSHVEWYMSGYLIEVYDLSEIEDSMLERELVWASAREVQNHYALPKAFHYYKKHIR